MGGMIMGLSDEDKRRIYEEEKARIEAREKIESEKSTGEGISTTSLKPNTAGLLCYLGIWVTGIIFLIIEKKNRFVRFHAMQSLIVFGILQIVIGIAEGIRSGFMWMGWAGYLSPEWVFATVVLWVFRVIMFVLWIVLMYQAHQGRLFKVPLFGNFAEQMLAKLDGITVEQVQKEEESTRAAPSAAAPKPEEKAKEKKRDYFEDTRTGRIIGSSAAIVVSIFLIVFLNFFSQYVAYYEHETVAGVARWQIYPLLTGDFSQVLPIITIALAAAITGHVILLIHDNYYLRQIILGVVDIFALTAVLVFFFIFPLDFNVVPNTDVRAILDIAVRVVLICVAIGVGIGILVRFIKLALGRR
ncbi:DUF4870 domain-containing protein [Chloroflexota bacterium]